MAQQKPRNKALGFIFITILLDVIGFGIIIPIIPNLISQIAHVDITGAAKYGSWLLFAYAIFQFICSPLMGSLSDKYGRRPVLLFSLLGLGIDYLFQAFSGSMVLLFIGRIIAGITGASFTTATAYIADVSKPEEKAQNFGLVGAAFGIGFIVGPSIGGLCSSLGEYLPIVEGFDWTVRLPYLVAAFFSIVNFIYGYFVLPESLKPEHRRDFDWKRANPIGSLMHLRKYPIVSGLVASLFCLNVASHAVQSNWSYYTMYKFHWKIVMVGISLSVVGVLVGLVQGLLIRVTIPKLGEKNSVYIGLSLFALGMLGFAFASESYMMFLILIPYCLGGIGMPALQGIVSNQVPHNEQGELQGALTSLMSVTSIIGPLLMNNLFAYFTSKEAPFIFPGMPFIIGTVLIFFAILLSIKSMKSYHNSKQTGSTTTMMGH